MSPRTVLHLIHTAGAGGAETVMLQLVEHLDPGAWRSVVGVPGEGWLHSALQRTDADVALVPGSGSFDIGLVNRLVRLARTRGVELVHTHLFGPALYGSIAARILGLPVVATIHGEVDLSVAHKWWGVKKRLLNRPANRFVTVTDGLRRTVVRELGVAPSLCSVITNGVDVKRFSPAPARGLREELGWGDGEVVIGAVGNVRRPKDYPNLLAAAALLRESCPRCRFVILGDTSGEPDLYRDLLARRSELGLEDTVVFAGFREDVVEALNNLDLYVMSSSREGLPLAILQAMAVRLPIVATCCGGPEEVLEHGGTALLVPPHDPQALATSIARLVERPDERDRLAHASHAVVNARYTLERMARAYERLYEVSLGGDAADASAETASEAHEHPRGA